jgi:hypothetical protein
MGSWLTRFRQVGDFENDDSLTDAVLRMFASMVFGELWSEVANGAGRYFEATTTISADGSASYEEPEAHYSTIRVVYVDADGRETPLRELRQQDEPYAKGVTGEATAYTLVDDQLYLYPTPSSGTYKWYYLQQATDLSAYADDDVVDVVCPAGEQFFTWGVVALALARQQKDARMAIAERERARGDLQFWAGQRNFSEPKQRLAEVDDDVIRTPGDWEPWR